jgi:phosphoglycerate kinase
MAFTNNLDSQVKKVRGLLAAMGLEKKIRISFDEWNLRGWHHPNVDKGLNPEDYIKPRDLNDQNCRYTMADAVFSACFLNMANRNCDLIGMANYAPVVNTRGIIYTHKEGIVLRSTYHVFDLYVNDAFAAAHRSQPSLVGFTEVIPSAAGLIMESELKTINTALENVRKPCIFILGGMKADDSIDVMENVLKNGTADFILTTGLVANIILLAADVNIGEINKNFMEEKGYSPMIEKSRDLLKKYKDNIIFPMDLAIEDNDERIDVAIDKMPNKPIFDIGIETIKSYAKIIRNAKTIFANGPAGVFENPKFAMGTEDLLNAIATSEGFSIIGGGHIAAAAVSMGFDEKMDHISSGGGACISLLAGKKLAAVDALVNSAEKFKNRMK